MRKPYNPHDRLMVKAKMEGYRARSVYKLRELDERFKLLKPGQRVLDIGASPGSWLQYTSEKIESQGLAIGIDLKPITPVAENVKTITADVNDPQTLYSLFSTHDSDKFDLVLSDIAPNTSGIADADHIRSIKLCEQVYRLVSGLLKPNGNLVMKVFPGREFDKLVNGLKKSFTAVKQVKVSASRERSREVYLICLSFKI